MIEILVWLAAAAWVFLLFFRQGFWRADERLDRASSPTALENPASVLALIPARNEATTIHDSVRSVLAQHYPGKLHLIVINDSSEDETAAIAGRTLRSIAGERLKSAEVINAPALAAGWSGKLAALNAGLDHAEARDFDMIWLSDADIVHTNDTLHRLVETARAGDRALVSLMVRLRCDSFWERMVIPAFIYFFQLLYPFRAVNNPRSPQAAAAGGCVLLNAKIFAESGGFAAMRDALIDDVTLGKQVKATGAAIWLGLDRHSRSIRASSGLTDLWAMVRRSAYTQLHYSPVLLVAVLMGLVLTFVVPVVGVLLAPVTGFGAAFIGILTWAAMAVSFQPTARLYDQPAWIGLMLPAIALLYGAMTIDSARMHMRGQTGSWKGRTYR